MTEILFDFYNLLVENVFGSVLVSVFGVAFVMIVMLMLSKSSMMFLFYWLLFYFIVMTVLYLGAIGLILGFLISFIYFTQAIIKLWIGNV